MAEVIKLKGVAKVYDLSEFGLRSALEKLLAKQGRTMYSEGMYKVSLAFKVGKRWKLKSYTVEVYNKFPCECCGPYYVAELVKPKG